MKSRRAAIFLPLLVTAYLFAFAAPPIYPGAKPVDELNQAAKAAGQDTTAYNTADAFGKVYDFYKTKGAEEQRAHRDKPGEKFAMITFKETGYTVAISWKESAKANGTVIHVAKGAPAR